MTDREFTRELLDGASFRQVSLRGATFEEVRLNDATLRDVDLSGVDIRAAYLNGVRMRGVEVPDLDVYGELGRVVVNGVDVVPFVEAELDRRMPERRLMHPTDPDGFREAWAALERLWAGTVDHARRMPEAALHERVDGEWSFVETLRHLGFATACWVGGMVLADPDPWDPVDLPWDEAPGWDGVPWDRQARPALDDVLEVRARRQAQVREVIAALTPEELQRTVSSATPVAQDRNGVTVQHALRVVLNEEWEHRLYAERDLAVLESRSAD
jgi:hypothetical protein